VKRAGLDYWHLVDINVYDSIEEYFQRNGDENIWLATTKAPQSYNEAKFTDGCAIIFGKETAGLPQYLREKYYSRCIRIPMRDEARSLNLANSAAILCYEALKQLNFPGLKGFGEMK
jgi:tRNA (cytidine/uridine-2'-O-)-methyltransferase